MTSRPLTWEEFFELANKSAAAGVSSQVSNLLLNPNTVDETEGNSLPFVDDEGFTQVTFTDKDEFFLREDRQGFAYVVAQIDNGVEKEEYTIVFLRPFKMEEVDK